MTPREVAEGLLACHCGKAGVKQDWTLVKEAAGGLKEAYARYGTSRGCSCLVTPWRVMPGVPFQLTEWRRDLVVCQCGAEGRLVQEWDTAWRGDPLLLPRIDWPVWMDETVPSYRSPDLKFVLWTKQYCPGCHELSGRTAQYLPWYAVPGASILLPVEAVAVALLRPQARRYCSLEG